MSILEIFIISIALAMDAFAVSLACGICNNRLPNSNAIIISGFFGGFQMLMPILGFLCAELAIGLIADYDHWIAFALLSIIGINMIRESINPEDENCKISSFANPLNFGVLFILAVATSIDAFAVGISFACLKNTILLPSVIIGIVTFAICLLGIKFGSRIGNKLGNKVGVVGGIVLILIGLKIILSEFFIA